MGLRAAVEALPFHPQLADQRVALVDRDQEDLPLRGAPRANTPVFGAVDEDGLHVRGQRPEQRVAGGQPVPGGQVQLALGRAAGARVARHHAIQRRVVEEEGHGHRDLKLAPVRVGKRPARIVVDVLRYGPVLAACRPLMSEEQITCAAGAGQRPFPQVHDVPVPLTEHVAAHLAPFGAFGRVVIGAGRRPRGQDLVDRRRKARRRTRARGRVRLPLDEPPQAGCPGPGKLWPGGHRAPRAAVGRREICSSGNSGSGVTTST